MTTETKTYNGYKNYETWAVALWIDNIQSTQEYWQQEIRTNVEFYPDDKGLYLSANQLKDYFQQHNPVADRPDVWADLMNAALSEVDWLEIAENLLED